MRRDICLPADAGAGLRGYLSGERSISRDPAALDRLEATGSGDHFRVLRA